MCTFQTQNYGHFNNNNNINIINNNNNNNNNNNISEGNGVPYK